MVLNQPSSLWRHDSNHPSAPSETQLLTLQISRTPGARISLGRGTIRLAKYPASIIEPCPSSVGYLGSQYNFVSAKETRSDGPDVSTNADKSCMDCREEQTRRRKYVACPDFTHSIPNS